MLKISTSASGSSLSSFQSLTQIICIYTVVPGCNNMWDCFFKIPLHFVITLEAPLDVEQEVGCGSQGEEDGPPRNGNSIDSLGRLMLWGIWH